MGIFLYSSTQNAHIDRRNTNHGLRTKTLKIYSSSARLFSNHHTQNQTRGYKVAVLGAAGGIGQPCGLLMKMNPLVTELRLYDIAGTPGVAADVSHINTK